MNWGESCVEVNESMSVVVVRKFIELRRNIDLEYG
jgi:hypothetical protein